MFDDTNTMLGLANPDYLRCRAAVASCVCFDALRAECAVLCCSVVVVKVTTTACHQRCNSEELCGCVFIVI